MKRHRDLKRACGISLGWALLAGAPLALTVTPPAFAQEQVYRFDIQKQALSTALLALGRQADLSVAASTSLTAGKTGALVQGEMSAASALEILLADTGLTYIFVKPDAVRIIAKEQAGRLDSEPDLIDQPGRDTVVVTGTNIRGLTPASSPVETYTRDDIARTGAATTEQFVGKIPQNSGTTSPYASGASANVANFDAATAIDLRGLGVGTTLTLLNGRRMALSSFGQSADISLIPLSAVERVEVLTDGASAIYGSDAIGGVVNFVLRDDFDGAETRMTVSGVTRGGMRQGGAGHTQGARWDGGHGLLSYDYFTAAALKASDRDYSTPSGPGTLTPVDSRHNIFATVSQDISDRLSIDADAGASWRKIKATRSNLTSPSPLFQLLQNYQSQTDAAFANIGVNYEVSETLHANLTASYAAVDTDGVASNVFFNRVPPQTTTSQSDSRNSQFDLVAKLDGSLLELPAGALRFSVGAGVLQEDYEGVSAATNRQMLRELGRRSTYGFGEVFVPLVSPSQAWPLVHRLSLDLAARYTDYTETGAPSGRDFGDSLDPKVGIAWSPVEAMVVRGTYGTSFRAPSLNQLDAAAGSHYLQPMTVGGAPSILLGLNGYAVPDLAPETAETYTFGFDYNNSADPKFRLSLTYYNIDYSDRIATAPTGGLSPFASPALLPDLIYRPPSAAFIEEALRSTQLQANGSGVDLSNPASAAAALFARNDLWVLDVRYKNLALSKQDGIDLSVSQGFDTGWGDVQLGLNLTHILNYEQRGSAASSVLPAVDVPGKPLDWRARAFAGIASGRLNATVSVNYADDYENTLAPVGQRRIDALTTVDANLGYDFSRTDTGAGLRLSLSIQNLLDEDPPFLARGSGSAIVYPIGFDPANANPLGRTVTLGLTHRW